MKTVPNKNYGLELLRMILCFWVVLFHCLKISNNNTILNFKRKMFHVPSFFFISFYFLFPIIRSKNTKKMIIRLERLLIPYLFWPLIIYIFFDNYKDCISHSLGHFVETFPIAISAFIISKYNIPNRITSKRYTIIFYCILGNYFIYNYKIFMEIKIYGHRYNYNGFDKNIFAILSFFAFYLIPIDNIQLNKLKLFINRDTDPYNITKIYHTFGNNLIYLI